MGKKGKSSQKGEGKPKSSTARRRSFMSLATKSNNYGIAGLESDFKILAEGMREENSISRLTRALQLSPLSAETQADIIRLAEATRQ